MFEKGISSLLCVTFLTGCLEPEIIETVKAANGQAGTPFGDGYVGCEWSTETLNVFENKKEKISFNYRYCEGLEKIQRYGHTIRFYMDEGQLLNFERVPLDPQYSKFSRGKPVMGIWKNDSKEAESFLNMLMTEANSGCVAKQFHEDTWRIGLSKEEFSRRGYEFKSLEEPYANSSSSERANLVIHTDDVRFPYSMSGECSRLGVDWEYVFREGIVFGYSPYLVNTQFYDLNSVTYTREK